MAKNRMSKAEREARKRVEAAFNANCMGMTFNVMDLCKIHKAGMAAVAEGADDEELGRRVLAFAETVRVPA